MRITAIDAATTTGVAYGYPGTPPMCETWSLAVAGKGSAGMGARGLRMLTRLSHHFDEFKPDVVWVEEPISNQSAERIGTNIETRIQLDGLVYMVHAIAHSRSIRVRMAERQSILKHFTGRPRYKEKDGGKKACLVRCKHLGWIADGYDQGDAAALWDFACAFEAPRAWTADASDRPTLAR